MNPPDLLEALAPVAEALESLGVAYYVGGSLASSAHGVPRASLDVDLMAELRPEHVTSLCQRLQDAYYLDPDRVGDAVARKRSFNLIHLATMLKVDVFVSRGRPFDREALARVRHERLGDAEAGRLFALVSAEDIVLLKLEWFRLGGETSERQWTDVLGVLKVARGALDAAYLDRWAGALGVADLLERARTDAGLA